MRVLVFSKIFICYYVHAEVCVYIRHTVNDKGLPFASMLLYIGAVFIVLVERNVDVYIRVYSGERGLCVTTLIKITLAYGCVLLCYENMH
jgi:hypothetical protein